MTFSALRSRCLEPKTDLQQKVHWWGQPRVVMIEVIGLALYSMMWLL